MQRIRSRRRHRARGAGAVLTAARALRAGALLAAGLAATALGTAPAAAGAGRHHAASPLRHLRAASDRRPCPDASTPATSAGPEAMRDAVVCLVNRQRAARGLPPLRASWRLDRSAQGWTNRMVASQSFTHGADFAARISAVGFSWQAAGENIATGYPTPQSVVGAWMASPDHCRNVLNPSYSFVGTGVDRRPVSSFGSGPATWTQDFALPIGARARSSNWGPARGCPY